MRGGLSIARVKLETAKKNKKGINRDIGAVKKSG